MQKTCFEKYLEESFKKYYYYNGVALTTLQVWDVFFPRKYAKVVNELELKKDRKNAIVLVGQSCCGKTTYARKFVEEHKDFVLVSMDKSVDDMGNRAFGKMLEARHKNIIIDGNWLHVNSRGALFKTLEELDYHIIILLMMLKKEDRKRMIESRVFELLATERLGTDATCVLDGVDVMKVYAEKMGLCVDEAKYRLRVYDRFNEMFDQEITMLEQELDDANFLPQIPSGIICLGADEVVIYK